MLLLPLLIWLGFWQLDRAEEKAAQQERWATLETQQWPLTGQVFEGQPVIIEGHYITDRQWLLDNRTRGGRAGYEVLTLFKPRQGTAVVINRGWTAGTGDRSRLPDISLDENGVRLEARVGDWPQPPVLGASEDPSGWPRRVQALSRENAVQSSGYDVSSTFLRLSDATQPGALQADWAPSRMGVSTHHGYAAQWFGLAIALVVLTVITSFRKHRNTDQHHD